MRHWRGQDSARRRAWTAPLVFLVGVALTLSGAAPASAVPCTIEGTAGDDHLEGTGGPDVICGLEGDDVLVGLAGDDTLDGGDGFDTASFEGSSVQITADIAAGTASGEGADRLVGVEGLVGSAFNDVLRGSDEEDELSGLAGTDLLYGLAAKDSLFGDDGEDLLFGGEGVDLLDGGADRNTCALGPGDDTRIACTPGDPADGEDTAGLFDITKVTAGTSGGVPYWTVTMAESWTTKTVRDHGYVLIFLDTIGSEESNFYALVRSDGVHMLGTLFRDRATDEFKGSLTVSRPDGRSVRVNVPLSRLEFGADRRFYRWYAQTLYTSTACPEVCFDLAPETGRIVRPLP